MRNVMVSAFVATAACSSPKSASLFEVPQRVGPPFGLDVLTGSMSSQQALDRVPTLRRATGALSLRDRSGTMAFLYFDEDDRFAEARIDVSDCESALSKLQAAWGRGADTTEGGKVWSAPDTRWAADITPIQGGCRLVFTHADYFGANPLPFGAPRRLKSGMTHDEAVRIAPDVVTNMEGVASGVLFGVTAAVTVDAATGQITAQWYRIPPRIVSSIAIAWGPATTRISDVSEWVNESAHCHALLDAARVGPAKTLRMYEYTPFRDWLGDGPDIAQLPPDVWRLSIDDFERAHPQLMLEKEVPVALRLPPTEWTQSDYSSVDLHVEDDRRVSRISISFPYDNDKTRDRMRAWMEMKWGPGREAASGTWTFDRAAHVTAVPDSNLKSWVVTVKRRE